MAGVSVTIESLNNVKRAFSDFQTDIESFSDKINSSTEQIITEVRQSLKKQESAVVSLEDKVSSLINEIEQIQTSIISVNSRISSLKTQIANLEKQKPQIEARISQLEQQKRQLEAQKNNSDGDTSNIGAQIRAIESQIQACRRTLSQIDERLSSARRQQAENERKSSELKDCKVKTESELSTTKSELSKAQSKLERLSVAGDSVEREINNLNIATRKFEQNTSSSNETSKSGLSKCIASIDDYLAVSLSQFNQSTNSTEYRSVEYDQIDDNGNVEHLTYEQPLVIDSDNLPSVSDGCLTFHNQNDATRWARHTFGEWRQTLSPEQENYFRQYGGSLYGAINNQSRFIHQPNEEISNIAVAIDDGLSQSSLPNDMVVYRGLRESDVLDMARHAGGPLEQGITLNELGFLSTSMTPDTSFCNDCSCVMRLVAVEGLHGAPLIHGDLAPVSNECEMLFARNHGIYIQHITRCQRSELVPNSQDDSLITVIDGILTLF